MKNSNCRKREHGFRGFLLFAVVLAAFALFGASPAVAQEKQNRSDQNSEGADSETDNQAELESQQHTNHLANETSLYLLSHAHNPVDWYPWGDEALEKARSENKPIFLSIGYSSCHWCHVMEDESFKDEEIAKLLNDNFVCIKVDREERPDIDLTYMEGYFAYNRYYSFRNRNGGWPLTMFLTPEKQPFFGATYVPARDGDRGITAGAGFLSIVKNIGRIWKESPDGIKGSAQEITKLTIQRLANRRAGDGAELDNLWVDDAIARLNRRFDLVHGGFDFDPTNSQLPKFPQPSRLEFLLDQLKTRGEGRLKENSNSMVQVTLDNIARGGIRDHLGGGFHRYSVDRYWHIPHFEKMLYDNAQLASLYAMASEHYDNQEYRDVTRSVIDFVLREMRDANGGFYSALDADSLDEQGKKEEGAFYYWTKAELKENLSAKQFELLSVVYGLNAKPNFEDKYFVLFFTLSIDELAQQLSITAAELNSQLDEIYKILMEVRGKRSRPLTDDKILTSWNGLMIRGLADAGRILKEQEYLTAAEETAEFMWNNLRTEAGRLYRTHTKGQAKLNAYINDYAFFIDGLLALHAATSDAKWLERAIELQAKQDELFWDERGGYFYTSDDHEELLVRTKPILDREIPSATSVSVNNLVTLAELTSDAAYRTRAEETAKSVSGLLAGSSFAAPKLLIGVTRILKDK